MDRQKEILHSFAQNLNLLREDEQKTSHKKQLCIDCTLSALQSLEPAPTQEVVIRELLPFLEGDTEALLMLCMRDTTDPTASWVQHEQTRAGAHGRIAYVKNPYNDQAYEAFAKTVPHAKANLCSRFEECCEQVAEGSVEYAILPIENSSDGKLFHFYSLLDRYELKLISTYSVDTYESSGTARFALVGNHLLLPSEMKDGALLQFEFYLTYDDPTDAYELPFVSKRLGIKMHRIDTLPLPYADNMLRIYHTVILKDREQLAYLLRFLSLRFPQYTPVGIYTTQE